MKKVKIAVAVIFLAGVFFALAGQSFAYPPFLIKARKFGAKDCTFCHVDPEGGPPWADRGKWLMDEKERRKADAVDVDWLADYKPTEAAEAKADEPKAVGPPLTSAAPTLEQELMKLEREWMEAASKHDRAALGRILADDFKAIDEQGNVINKANYIEDDMGLKVDSYSFNDVATQVYGDSAIITYRLSFKGSHKGTDISGDYRQTNVWVKRDGRWQAVALHLSRIPQR